MLHLRNDLKYTKWTLKYSKWALKCTKRTLKPLNPKPQKVGGSNGGGNKLARSIHEMDPAIDGIDLEIYEPDTEIYEQKVGGSNGGGNKLARSIYEMDPEIEAEIAALLDTSSKYTLDLLITLKPRVE